MRWTSLLIVLLILFGCKPAKDNERYSKYDDVIDSGKPLALGDERDVYVFCDAANWRTVDDLIIGSIERKLNLVYPEQYFKIMLSDISEYKDFSQYRNLFLIGDLSSAGPVSSHMQATMVPEYIARVKQSGGDLFTAKNFASRDQLTLYLLASDPANLRKMAAFQSENIFQLLLKRYRDRLGHQAYQQKLIPASFFEPYPFSLKIPNHFTLYSNDRKGNFLSFLYRARMESREIPDKYISIYFEEMPENELTHAWLIQKRLMIGEKYFEGDIFEVNSVRQDSLNFVGQDALRLTGAWTNAKHLIGGAFQSFAFWHEGKAYIVDNSVYFPAGDKLSVLQELFVISSSLSLD